MGELLFMIILASPMVALLQLFSAWIGITSLNKRPVKEFEFRLRFGYTSSLALKNDEVWDYARYYYNSLCKKVCFYVIIITDLFYAVWFLFLKEYTIVPLIIFVMEFMGYFWYAGSKTTEHLKEVFDEQGNRREI